MIRLFSRPFRGEDESILLHCVRMTLRMATGHNHPLNLARRWFAKYGLGLTDNAQRAVAIAMALAGRAGECDDAYLSLGLRAANSVFAFLTDKYHLRFDEQDEEIQEYVENKEADVVEELIEMFDNQSHEWAVDDELRDSGSDHDDAPLASLYSADQSVEESWFVGVEGEPDPETVEVFLGNLAPDVFRLGMQHSRAARRRFVEASDLVLACADLPLTRAVFDTAGLSHSLLRNEISRYRALEPFAESQKLVLTFESGRIKARSYGLLDGYRYEDRQLGPQQVVVQVTTPSVFITQGTLDEFEDLVNWERVCEKDVHKFFVDHPELLLGDQYTKLHSQLILDCGDRGKLIPDFFAESCTSEYCDLIDLKKPNQALIVGRKYRRGFSAAVNNAIYQLRHYRDFFDEPRRRGEFYSTYGLRAFKPRIAVIIGRTPPDSSIIDFIEAKRSVPDADVITYDDIIARAKRRLLTVAGR